MDKEKIRSLYGEFIGYLSQLPMPKRNDVGLDDESLWTQYNDSVRLLSKVSGEDYSSFLIEPLNSHTFGPFIRLVTYRQKLGGLIAKLHREYFETEQAPFSGGPDVVISQTQQQSQSLFIQMLLDVQSRIDEKLPTLKDGSDEKGFLQKLKSTLSGVTNIVGLIAQILSLAKEYGISVDRLSELFRVCL